MPEHAVAHVGGGCHAAGAVAGRALGAVPPGPPAPWGARVIAAAAMQRRRQCQAQLEVLLRAALRTRRACEFRVGLMLELGYEVAKHVPSARATCK